MVKRHTDLNGYGSPVAESYGIQFKERDSVHTQVTVNHINADLADYLVAANDQGEIVSRWYILENYKNREGQYELTLLRDVIADYYDEVINAPTFIEKATLSANNPLIFNNENMTYNQIKQEEVILKDKFAGPWIVGYVDRKASEVAISIPAQDYVIDYSLTSLDEYDYYEYTTTPYRLPGSSVKVTLGINCYQDPLFSSPTDYTIGFDTNGNAANPSNRTYLYQGVSRTINGVKEGLKMSLDTSIGEVKEYVVAAAKTIDWNSVDYSPYIPTAAHFLDAEIGKLVQVGDNYYRIDREYVGVQQRTNVVGTTSALGLKMKIITDNTPELSAGTEPYYLCFASNESYKLKFTQITIDAINLTFPGESNRAHCLTTPYDIFAIPYRDYYVDYPAGETWITTGMEKGVSMRMAQQLQIVLGSQLYDLQLLPYCPLPPEVARTTGHLDLRYWGTEYEKYVSPITKEGYPGWWLGSMYWLTSADFQVNLNVPEIEMPRTAVGVKVMNETKVYRICSPNYSGVFEINAAKNGGLKNFIAYCSYKPVTPYIQVAPEFNNLYGRNFQDARGLICSGDFSLPRTQSAWIEYELANKNYQVMFNRQIENLEVNNQISRTEAAANAIVGTMSGAASGAVVGMGAGGGAGAAIGGAVGGIASGIGGIIDYDILLKRQRETLDFTQDQFGYSLGNIKAQPTSLTRVSAFNINNKIFPFLEIYGCSIEEEKALINKLTYNGMTVMAIGTIGEYLQIEPSYIKGKVIRLENLKEDYHLAVAISEEINKGVFI